MSEVAALADKLIKKVDSLSAKVDSVEKSISKPDYRAGREPAQPIDHKEKGRYGFKSLGDYAHAVRLAGRGGNEHFSRLGEQLDKGREYTKSLSGAVNKAILGLNESVDSEGNFLIPPTFSNEIYERAYSNDLLSRTDQYSVTGRTMVFPANAETSRVNGSRAGGVLSYWADEGQPVTATKPTFRRLTLTLRKLMVFGVVTQELLEDAPQTLGTYLSKKFSEEVEFRVGDAIINGTSGAGQPRGILNSPAKVAVSKESNQQAATIAYANVVKMYSRMWAPSRKSAAWFINQDVEPQLLTLTMPTGTTAYPVYLPPGGASEAPYGTIFGRPVIPIEFCPTLGTEGDIILADLSQYAVISKGAPDTQMSMHLYFDSDQMAYRTIFRIDGESWWNAPLTPYKGSATQSPIITLATRS